MNIFASGTVREVAKYSMDVSKLPATGAFITPSFSTTEVAQNVIDGMAVTAVLTFIIGIGLHRIADHMAGKD